MLTQKHFEAIGRLVYQSTLMESRLSLWLCVLKGEDRATWFERTRDFRFSKAIKELKDLAPSVYGSRVDEVLLLLREADALNTQRNDIVHGFWQLPSDVLFGAVAEDIEGRNSSAKALRVPQSKKEKASRYEVCHTAEAILQIAQKMQDLTINLVGLSLQPETPV